MKKLKIIKSLPVFVEGLGVGVAKINKKNTIIIILV